MSTAKTYDVVLFGATGFTGRLTAEYLAAVQTPRPLRWAIAGRSRDKLEAVRAELAGRGPNASCDVLVADVGNEASLAAMAAQAKVVATTVGPYINYGEPLVKACVSNGAHYVDLTGEPEFVDMLLEKYQAEAEQKRVKIVNACGFDSIPHDLGAYFALKALDKRLSPEQRGKTPVNIEGFLRASGSISGGTWHSAVTAMGRAREYSRLRKQRKVTLPTVGSERKIGATRSSIFFKKELGLWALPMPTIDPQVVRRSARLLPEYGPEFRYGHFMALKRLPEVIGMVAGVSATFVLAQFKATRNLLLKWKDPGQGPTEEERKRAHFRVVFFAEGGGQKVRCEVRGGDPGYGETAKMLAESALCLAFDGDKLPQHYGIVPSAAAMGQVLLERLRAVGISFNDTTPSADAPKTAAREATLAN